jgi:hypothetical protein
MDSSDQLLGELARQKAIQIEERALTIERFVQIRGLVLGRQALKMRGQGFVESMKVLALSGLAAKRTRGEGIDR